MGTSFQMEQKYAFCGRSYDGPKDLFQEQSEVRLPLHTGIVGHVASTGKLLNIMDAYHHPLFYRGFDQETGFKTR